MSLTFKNLSQRCSPELSLLPPVLTPRLSSLPESAYRSCDAARGSSSLKASKVCARSCACAFAGWLSVSLLLSARALSLAVCTHGLAWVHRVTRFELPSCARVPRATSTYIHKSTPTHKQTYTHSGPRDQGLRIREIVEYGYAQRESCGSRASSRHAR